MNFTYFKYFIFSFLSVVLVSCQSNEDDLQKIDQTLHIYITDQQGEDLLNSSSEVGYARVTMSDVGGEFTSEALKGYSLKRDSLDHYYIEYSAGGTRNLVGESGDEKKYQSDFTINYFIKNVVEVQDVDDVTVDYLFTPTLFQVQNFNLNGETIFTKVDGQPNIVKIVK